MTLPELASKQIIETLKAAGSPARAEQSRVYFKADEDVQFYGLSTPEARQVERKFATTLRRLAMNLLRREKSDKRGAQVKRLKAALNEKYLLKVLRS